MLGRRELIRRMVEAVAGTWLATAFTRKTPEASASVVMMKKETDFVLGPVRTGSFVCNRESLGAMLQESWTLAGQKVSSTGATDGPTRYRFDGFPLIVSEFAPDGGPYWVPEGSMTIYHTPISLRRWEDLMGPTTLLTVAVAGGIVHLVLVTLLYDRILRWFRRRRPRSVELTPGLYHFADGKVEDGWLEWRPVAELFR